MNQTWTIELFVYLVTALSALLLLPRCANWRLRLVVGTIGMQALVQSVTELRLNHPFWQTRLASLFGVVEMFGGALALTAIYLLRRENKERKSTDARLRLSEAVEGLPALGKAVNHDAVRRVKSALSEEEAIPDPAMDFTAAQQRNGAGTGESTRGEEIHTNRSKSPHKMRKTRRFPVSFFARLTRLDSEKQVFECELADISQGGARLYMPEFIPPGGLVKLEFRDRMFLGEVCRCEESDGQFSIGVRFEHMIDLTNLSRILREIGFEARNAGAQDNGSSALPDQNRSFAGKNSAISSS